MSFCVIQIKKMSFWDRLPPPFLFVRAYTFVHVTRSLSLRYRLPVEIAWHIVNLFINASRCRECMHFHDEADLPPRIDPHGTCYDYEQFELENMLLSVRTRRQTLNGRIICPRYTREYYEHNTMLFDTIEEFEKLYGQKNKPSRSTRAARQRAHQN